jgi:hypothetical protein
LCPIIICAPCRSKALAEVVAWNHTKRLGPFRSDDLLIHTGVSPCRVLISLSPALALNWDRVDCQAAADARW